MNSDRLKTVLKRDVTFHVCKSNIFEVIIRISFSMYNESLTQRKRDSVQKNGRITEIFPSILLQRCHITKEFDHFPRILPRFLVSFPKILLWFKLLEAHGFFSFSLNRLPLNHLFQIVRGRISYTRYFEPNRLKTIYPGNNQMAFFRVGQCSLMGIR